MKDKTLRILDKQIKRLQEINLELGDLDYQSPGTRRARFQLEDVLRSLIIVKEHYETEIKA